MERTKSKDDLRIFRPFWFLFMVEIFFWQCVLLFHWMEE